MGSNTLLTKEYLMTNVTIPLDSDINEYRNRHLRLMVLLGFYGLTLILSIIFTTVMGAQFFPGNSLVFKVCFVFGLAAGVGICIPTTEKLFLIRNPTTGMFITQDTLASLTGIGDVNIAYGPGTHLSFPWERRLEGNNISLEEAANAFDFTVQCSDGILQGSGSFRLRPDQSKPVTFLSSVSAVADDITDLIIQEILAKISGLTVKETLLGLKTLNVHLDQEFRGRKTEIEERCGVHISDVTVSKLLPTAELQRTLSAISEAEAIAQGVSIILGMDQATMRESVKNGTLSQEDINRARRDFLSVSGNLDGMEIKRQEFDLNIRGLDGDAIKAITELAKIPAIQAAAAGFAARKSGGSNKTKGKKS
jgi:SPFH domain / Band 7 family